MGSAVLLASFVHRELGLAGIVRGRWRYAALGAGFFLASFDVTGRWFHLARVDALFLLLLLAGTYVLRFASSASGAVGAGLLLGASYLTKQSALAACLPVLAASLVRERRRTLLAAASFGAVIAVSTVGFEFASDGWYRYFVFELPA